MSEWNSAAVNGCPCYGCEKRKPGCHAGCEGYKAWRKKMDKRKEEEQRIRKSKDTLSENAIRQIWRKTRWGYSQSRRRSGQER
jgi:hypothetical protein